MNMEKTWLRLVLFSH